MSVFDFSGKCEVSDKHIDIMDVIDTTKRLVNKYYSINKIHNNDSSVSIKGNIKGFFKRAVTNVVVSYTIKDSYLIYKAKGKVTLGFLPWLWLLLMVITGYACAETYGSDFEAFFGLSSIFFFIIFISELVKYSLCKSKPAKYFEEIMETIKFDFGKI